MSSFDEFNAWWINYRGFDDYHGKTDAWDSWRAARTSERERCAKVCEAMTGEYPWKCAAAIRELGDE
jgi:hypothetical protein